MNNIFKTAIFVMAMMISATFAFGQGNTSDKNPTDGTTVKMILEHPSMDTWTFEITHRWKDNLGNWGPWETIKRDAAGGGQTVLYLWTSVAATEYEYQIIAKKSGGAFDAGTQGLFLINGTPLYVGPWFYIVPKL